jgi:hypothetical protein
VSTVVGATLAGSRTRRYGSEALALATYFSDIDVAVALPPLPPPPRGRAAAEDRGGGGGGGGGGGHTRSSREAALQLLGDALRRSRWADAVTVRR